MAVDEALLLCAAQGPPTLRLYTWLRPALSLGYRQPAPDWLERCAGLGVDVVRRVSGGGTVLHAGDLTYAVVAPLGTPALPDDLHGSYAWIRSALLDGLRELGISARPSQGEADSARLEVCFAGATVCSDGSRLDCKISLLALTSFVTLPAKGSLFAQKNNELEQTNVLG